MELTLHPLAKTCRSSGRAFAEGDRVLCYLVREATGEIGRHDLLEAEDTAYGKPAEVLCRWVVVFKPRHGQEDPGRTLRLTAENLFVTLAGPEAVPDEANTPMLQFLALLLERKKLLRPRGLTPDGARQIYEQAKTHQRYEIPMGRLDEAFFVNIQKQLGQLLGPGKTVSAAEPAAAS